MLDLSAKISEAEVHWREFLADLHKRGLSGVELRVIGPSEVKAKMEALRGLGVQMAIQDRVSVN